MPVHAPPGSGVSSPGRSSRRGLPAARRTRIVAVVVAGVLAVACARGALGALHDVSALSTSYSVTIEPRQSLVLDAYETLSGMLFFWSAAGRLAVPGATDRERLTALMEWTHENVRPQYAAPGRIVADNFIDIVRRGHGYCDQSAHVFAVLAHYAGYDVHLLFLRAIDGSSPHTVAEVRVDGRWVVVDPWLGTLFLDDAGRPAGVADLGTTARLPPGYQVVGAGIDEGHFRRATRFESFPYQSWSGLLQKVWRRVSARAGDVRAPRTPATPSARAAPDSPAGPLRAAIIRLDGARRAHVEGRHDDAIAGYREVLGQPIPADMAESVRFFLGLALLRAGSPREAIRAFDAALEAEPRTSWRPSILRYRADARGQIGDVAGARADLRDAGTPAAIRKLADLGGEESLRR